MRAVTMLAFAVLCASTTAEAQRLYKHVDENGKVTFTDRAPTPGQKPEKLKAANVETPDARRQTEYAHRERQREEQAERMAQQQRYQSQRRREFEAEQERRTKERDPNSPIQDPYRPHVRR
jgi:hypothetical protein